MSSVWRKGKLKHLHLTYVLHMLCNSACEVVAAADAEESEKWEQTAKYKYKDKQINTI